ncbi:hypothetical protein BCR32DRAFT_268146 [Anaeromyces robustus]|uniref:Protein YAE1 n=1 Tax=Anaeromyces robustus TaxID=1754192 RepID=A0A1Y1X7H5_9FUNG|nr:hypothetical protein BCR32DRAFT_268146 [Anaeromyces robustus]|eukprot:ORX81695.1 hypothetical protein BCR32DRAFT_268146 [Anaeromyces robustus]
MDDDIWDDYDDAEYDRVMSERNFKRMNEINTNMGYIQGIDYGKESTLQQSFETGFKIGLDNGIKLGEQYGKASALKFLNENDSEMIKSIIKKFEEKFKDFKNVEHLYEEKKELKDLEINNNEEIFIPTEIKSFITDNQNILNLF